MDHGHRAATTTRRTHAARRAGARLAALLCALCALTGNAAADEASASARLSVTVSVVHSCQVSSASTAMSLNVACGSAPTPRVEHGQVQQVQTPHYAGRVQLSTISF